MIKHLDKIEYQLNYPQKFPVHMNLGFFADKDEKTEEATTKKKQDARKEGQVAKSPELATAFLFIAAFSTLRMFAGSIFRSMREIFNHNFVLLAEIDDIFTNTFMISHINSLFIKVILTVAPLFAILMFVGIASNIVQVGWNVTTKPLMPKVGNLNPLSGLKRLFSVKAIVNLVKSLAKMLVIIYTIYTMFAKELKNIPGLAAMSILESIEYLGNLAINMGLTVGVLFLFIALADVVYTRFSHGKQLRMTKQEVKDEYKQAEGDPHIKGKIRRKMQEISMRRMMQDVPKADVIITNPTHYAVALVYEKTGAEAPRVVAKGVDFMARKIREKAKENNVQIVENKQLARTLYATVEVGQVIPPELYQAVAEILAFVYKLRQ